MAKSGDRIPGSNRDQVLAYLREHPGQHRPTDIAAALGWTDPKGPHRVAIAARGLAVEQGLAIRGELPAANGGRPYKTYAAAPVSVGAAVEDENTNPPPN